MKFGVGQPVKRVEDVRLVSGQGAFASDYAPEGALHAAFLRSPHAHAKFAVTDVEAARALPGVRGIFVASDFAALGGIPCRALIPNADGSKTPAKPYPVMASEEAHHVGDIVAMAVADTQWQARDAVEALVVDWDALPPVVDVEAAIRPGAAQVYAQAPGNVAYDGHIGDKVRTDAIFEKAAHVARVKVVNQRVVANYMEARAAVAEYDAGADRVTLRLGSQGVHAMRKIVAGGILKTPEEKLRVVTADVGGGFGTKIFVYREYPLLIDVARRLGRAVIWRADRSEHFVG